jgi:hypothetical protein
MVGRVEAKKLSAEMLANAVGNAARFAPFGDRILPEQIRSVSSVCNNRL